MECRVWWTRKLYSFSTDTEPVGKLLKVARNFQAFLERHWMFHCLSHPQSLLFNYSLWVKFFRISLIALFPPYPNPFPKRGRRRSFTITYMRLKQQVDQSPALELLESDPASGWWSLQQPFLWWAQVVQGTSPWSWASLGRNLKHSKQMQEVFRASLTARSLQVNNEPGLRTLGHEYRWASNSPASLPDMTPRNRWVSDLLPAMLRGQVLLTLPPLKSWIPWSEPFHLQKNHLSGEAPREQLGINQSAVSCLEEFGLSGDQGAVCTRALCVWNALIFVFHLIKRGVFFHRAEDFRSQAPFHSWISTSPVSK